MVENGVGSKLYNREDARNTVLATTEERLRHIRSVDKETHPILTCMSAPGTGKSLLAQTVPTWLKESHDPKLRAMATKDPLIVCISFNSDTKFNAVSEASDGNNALSWRLLASYFGQIKESVIAGLGRLPLFNVCLDAIVKDHRARHPYIKEEDTTLIYLAVDDVTSLMHHPVTLRSITDALGEQSIRAQSNTFFVPLLTGTIDVAVALALSASSHPRKRIPVPLLPHDDADSMIKDSGFTHKRKLLTLTQKQELDCLVLDIAGLPRGMQVLINYLCAHADEQDVVSDARMDVGYFFQDRYPLSNLEQFERLLIMSILRLSVDKNDHILPGGGQTYGDLEIGGGVLLSQDGLSYQVVVPMIQVYAYLKRRSVTEPLAKHLSPVIKSLRSPQSWEGWEKFNIYHHVLLNYCWSVYSGDVTLGCFYAGALICDSISNVELVLSKNGDYDWFDAPAGQFPDEKNEKFPVENFLSGRVMLNAAGSCVDGLAISRTNSGTLCARLLCMAHTKWGETLLKTSKAVNDAVKAEECICRYLSNSKLTQTQPEAAGKKEFSMVPVILSNRELAKSFTQPPNSVVVSKLQIAGFYGRSFAPHVQARVRNIKTFCTLARQIPPCSLLANPLHVCFRVGAWTLKHV